MQDLKEFKSVSATLRYSSINDILSEIEALSKTNTSIEKQIAKIEGGERLKRAEILTTFQATTYHLGNYRTLMDAFLDTCIKEESKIFYNKHDSISPSAKKCFEAPSKNNNAMNDLKNSVVKLRTKIEELHFSYTGKKWRPSLTVIHGGKSKKGLC